MTPNAMTRMGRAIRTSALLLIAGLSLAANVPQSASLAKGQSVYVVAVRDTRILMMCPSKRAEADYSPTYPGSELTPAWAEPFPGAPDRPMRERVEQIIRKQNRFKVATSAESADLVFIVNSQYRARVDAMMPGIGADASDRPVWSDWLDSKTDEVSFIAAIAVPAEVYRKGPTDPVALGKARIWEGMEANSVEDPSATEMLLRAFAAGRGTSYRSSWVGTLGSGRVCATPQPPRAARIELAPDGVAPPPAPTAEITASPAGAATPAAPSNGSKRLATVVPVIVTVEGGLPASDLDPSAFKVFEDEVERHVEGTIPDAEPVTAALLIDSSYSMQPQLTAMKAAASAFIDRLRPDDRVLIASFDSRIYVACEATGDRAFARGALGRLRTGGPTTRLFDAIDTMAAERMSRIPGRRVMVLMTDGQDSGSGWVSDVGSIDQARASHVPVYVAQFDAAQGTLSQYRRALPKGAEMIRAPEEYLNPTRTAALATRYLSDLASATGGQFERTRTPDELNAAMQRIADEVRHQYFLYFYPPISTPDAGRSSDPRRGESPWGDRPDAAGLAGHREVTAHSSGEQPLAPVHPDGLPVDLRRLRAA